MAPELLRWPFTSPRRLLTILAAVVAAVVLGLWALAPDMQTPATTSTGAAAEKAPDVTTGPAEANEPTPTVSSSEDAARSHSSQPGATEKLTKGQRAAARRTSRAFTRAWLSGRDDPPRRKWLARVRRHVTPELWVGLRLTDPSALPRGRVETVTVTAAGAFAADTTVHLSSGTTLLVRVVDDGQRWRVTDVRQEQAR